MGKIKTKLPSISRDTFPLENEFDPVLSQINKRSLSKMFENNLSFSMKALKLNSHSNQQRLLNIELFKTCWSKFGPFLPKLYYAHRLIESGESLMQMDGFQNIADTHCFSKFLNEFIHDLALPDLKSEEMEALMIRAKYGRAMTIYIRIISMDPCLQSQLALDELQKVLSDLLEIMTDCAQSDGLSGLLLAGSYHVRSICEHASKHHNQRMVTLLILLFIRVGCSNHEIGLGPFGVQHQPSRRRILTLAS